MHTQHLTSTASLLYYMDIFILTPWVSFWMWISRTSLKREEYLISSQCLYSQMTLTEVLSLADRVCPLTMLEAEQVYWPAAVLSTLVNGSTTSVSIMWNKKSSLPLQDSYSLIKLHYFIKYTCIINIICTFQSILTDKHNLHCLFVK